MPRYETAGKIFLDQKSILEFKLAKCQCRKENKKEM